MSTDSVSSLRQRMIEDMNARKLCAGTQRGHIGSCKVRGISEAIPGHGDIGGHSFPMLSTHRCLRSSKVTMPTTIYREHAATALHYGFQLGCNSGWSKMIRGANGSAA